MNEPQLPQEFGHDNPMIDVEGMFNVIELQRKLQDLERQLGSYILIHTTEGERRLELDDFQRQDEQITELERQLAARAVLIDELMVENGEYSAANRVLDADSESWYQQCEDARDALIRNGREADARLAEKDAALGALASAAQTILDVVRWPRNKNCPHGNSASYPAHGWWCDACFEALEQALAPDFVARAEAQYREALTVKKYLADFEWLSNRIFAVMFPELQPFEQSETIARKLQSLLLTPSDDAPTVEARSDPLPDLADPAFEETP